MLLCMRTTIDIDDDLLLELKRAAAEKKQSLRTLIEDAIRSSLSRFHTDPGETAGRSVLTFRGNGVRPGINLDSMRELLDIMEGSS
jgi:Arc/MetJ family transcription regulator